MAIEFRGGENLRRKLDRVAAEVRRGVRREVQRGALAIQGRARRNLHEGGTTDTGRLAGSIAIEDEQGGLDARVGTNVEYAAAIEFGLPPGTRPDVAGLTGWVRRKLGVQDPQEARSIAFAIAAKIRRRGTEAQPYLFPAAEAERPKFRAAVGRAVDEALRRVAREG
ncbi:MAG TPA: HK97 gp10 family phage protein [Longimicrobiales bacterium]